MNDLAISIFDINTKEVEMEGIEKWNFIYINTHY
jgi:hypothetical protein